jgi:hypothetical protein
MGEEKELSWFFSTGKAGRKSPWPEDIVLPAGKDIPFFLLLWLGAFGA